jgi:prohibitin 2
MFLILSILLAIAAFFAASYYLATQVQGAKIYAKKKGAMYGFCVLFVGIFFSSFVQVPSGSFGIQTLFGSIQDDPLSEGAHFINPLARVQDMSLQTFKATLPKESTGTKDLQVIHTDLAVNWRVQREHVIGIYRSYRNDIGETILLPVVSESLRAVTARHDSEELLTKRDAVSAELLKELREKLNPHHIDIVGVAITNFGFSPEYQQAIEAKVVAAQKKLKAEQDLQRIEVEAKSRIAQAEGEAKAISIQSQAIQSSGGANYVQLQAIQKWDGKLPTTTSAAVPFLNLK